MGMFGRSNQNVNESSARVNNLGAQPRSRTWSDYCGFLDIREDLPLAGTDILLVGGGIGCYGFPAYVLSEYNFTNIDLELPKDWAVAAGFITSVQGDFVAAQHFAPNTFDEILALQSLPIYAVCPDAARLFYLRAMLALRPGGNLRVQCGSGTAPRGITENYPGRGIVSAAAAEMVRFLQKYGVQRKIEDDVDFYHNGVFGKPRSPSFDLIISREIDRIMESGPDFSFVLNSTPDLDLLDIDRPLATEHFDNGVARVLRDALGITARRR